MSTVSRVPVLPQLPVDGWEKMKTTLLLWRQIVGKIRMASTAPRNHWHVPLYVDVRGLTTRCLHSESGVAFAIVFGLIDHRLGVSTDRGDVDSLVEAHGLQNPTDPGSEIARQEADLGGRRGLGWVWQNDPLFRVRYRY